MENKIDIMLNKLINFEYFDYKNYYIKEEDFLINLKEYLKKNKNKAYELSILKDIVLYGDINSKDVNVLYLDKDLPLNAPNYILDIQDILRTYRKNKISAFRKVKGIYSSSNFANKIVNFDKKFLNAELYKDMLNDILSNMTYKLDVKHCPTYVPKNVGEAYIIDDEVLQSIYDSGLSLLDYAVKHKVDYVKLNAVISTSKKQALAEIKERQDTVEDMLVELIKKIANNEMDFMDYYKVCKLNPLYLRPYVTKYNLQGKTISSFINKNCKDGDVTLEKEENSKIIIDGVEVPYEIKKEAIELIQEVEAPVTKFNYTTIVRKLMKKQS